MRAQQQRTGARAAGSTAAAVPLLDAPFASIKPAAAAAAAAAAAEESGGKRSRYAYLFDAVAPAGVVSPLWN